VVARTPRAFQGGLRARDGGHWLVGQRQGRDVEWVRNPALVVPAACRHVVRLYWRAKGGMAPGPLPEAGGVNDQPAWLLTAFDLLAEAEAEMDRAETAEK